MWFSRAMALPDSTVQALGLRIGMVVQELGWDTDVDEGLREQLMDFLDDDLVEEVVEAVDAVLLWQRDDIDVADSLVDALTDLDADGIIWLAIPKIGREGHVPDSDIAEAAKTAGLALTSVVDASHDWSVRKLVRPKRARN